MPCVQWRFIYPPVQEYKLIPPPLSPVINIRVFITSSYDQSRVIRLCFHACFSQKQKPQFLWEPCYSIPIQIFFWTVFLRGWHPRNMQIIIFLTFPLSVAHVNMCCLLAEHIDCIVWQIQPNNVITVVSTSAPTQLLFSSTQYEQTIGFCDGSLGTQ